MSTERNPLSDYSESLVKAVEKAGKSTVLVDGRQRLPASGIAFTQDLIVTADHVVEREDNLSVVLADGTRIPATIAGRDPGSDIALLRLEKAAAQPAEKATQEARVGEIVMALGRPSLNGIEASLGIVSSIGGPVRTHRGGLVEHFLLTDTTPFPGFSGGPLVDTQGRILGLNTSGFAHGAAITIPTALVWTNAENLAQHGHVKRGYLGIRSQTVTLSEEMRSLLGREQETGLLIVSVETDSPAVAGGLMVGDILVGMESSPVSDHDELMLNMTGRAVGKQTEVEILRGGRPLKVTVTLGERS